MGLKEGDMYLRIRMETGRALNECWKAMKENRDFIDIAAFKNSDKKDGEDSKPDFKSKDLGIWKAQKKAQQPKTEDI